MKYNHTSWRQMPDVKITIWGREGHSELEIEDPYRL